MYPLIEITGRSNPTVCHSTKKTNLNIQIISSGNHDALPSDYKSTRKCFVITETNGHGQNKSMNRQVGMENIILNRYIEEVCGREAEQHPY